MTKLFFHSAASFTKNHWRLLVVLLVSVALAALYLIGRPYILYNDSDPLAYMGKAWWLLNRAPGADTPSRGPGYPIWLILTGAASLDTWWGLMTSQIAMTMAAPLLFYGILAPLSRNGALVAALLFMSFGIPYQYMTWVMTEELFLFVELVAFLCISRYLCASVHSEPEFPGGARGWSRIRYYATQWVASPFAIALALAYATMTKPAAGPFFWVFILVCFLFRVEPWKRYIGPALLYMSLMLSWDAHTYFKSPVRFPTLSLPTTTEQRYFSDAYFGDGYKEQRVTILPEDGPASLRLYQAVSHYVAELRLRNEWNVNDPRSAHQLYERFASNDALVQNIFANPNPVYFNLISQAAQIKGDGNKLLFDVAREHGRTGIKAFVRHIVRNPQIPFLGPPNPYVGYMFFMKYYRYRDYTATGQNGPRQIFIGTLNDNLIREANGIASKAYADSIIFFIDTFPQYADPQREYLNYFGSSEAFKNYLIENPYFSKYSGGMMGTIYTWLIMLHGEEQAGRIMTAAAIEATMKNHATWGFLAGDFLAVAALASNSWVSTSKLVTNFHDTFVGLRNGANALLVATVESGRTKILPAKMASQLAQVGIRTDFAKNVDATLAMQYSVFRSAKLILFLCLCVFFPLLIISGTGGRLVAFLTLAFFAGAAGFSIVSIPPHGDPRHEDVFAFIPLVIAVLGFVSIPRFLELARRRRTKR